VIDRIAELMKHETAGDPMTGLKWTHKTTVKVAAELQTLGIDVSPRTVAKLLKQMGYSLRVNHKKLSRVSKTSPEDRDAQFAHIKELRERCAADHVPLISIDTKKKELIGRFKNPGVAWSQEPIQVKDHDFRSEAIGKAIPYGIYDIHANRGTVFVGTSIDTPKFAVDSIETWWSTEARDRYPDANELVILADGGGSNGSQSRVWKHDIYEQLCARHGLTVTVAHYPPGTSKWNPIEHQLFSEISKNWAGRPLETYEIMLNCLRSTTTTTGLQVRAHLVEGEYEKGIRISDARMKTLPMTRHEALPRWNYTIQPA
jgi:Rhodopirellula transposase DDE domain